LLKWMQVGARKFPENRTILAYLDQAYYLSGQTDSALAATQRLVVGP